MEEKDPLQSNSDDEIVVRQADGTFKTVKWSELGNADVPLPRAIPVPTAAGQKLTAQVMTPISPSQVLSSIPPSVNVSGTPPHSGMPDFDRQADNLVERLALDVSGDLKPRLKMLLISYFKGIRQEYAVRTRLLQSVESGGLGWAEDRADLFLKQMKALSGMGSTTEEPIHVQVSVPQDNEKVLVPRAAPSVVETPSNLLPELEPEMRIEKIDEAPPQPRRVEPLPIPKPRPAQMSSVRPSMPLARPPKPPQSPQKQIQRPLQPQPTPISAATVTQPAPRTSDGIHLSTPQPLKIVEEGKGAMKVIPQDPAEVPIKQPPHIAIPQTPSGKADVKDIAYKPRLVGPIEELHSLTLIDFRRLSRDPQVAADKIHAKVELLGEESFEKKIKGVLAWRESEVNGLYTTLLNESIKTGMSIKDVVTSYTAQKKPTLTVEEVQAVMKLNRQLRF